MTSGLGVTSRQSDDVMVHICIIIGTKLHESWDIERISYVKHHERWLTINWSREHDKITLVILAGNWLTAPRKVGSKSHDVKIYTLVNFIINNRFSKIKSHGKYKETFLGRYCEGKRAKKGKMKQIAGIATMVTRGIRDLQGL